jgi:hypothetical protein
MQILFVKLCNGLVKRQYHAVQIISFSLYLLRFLNQTQVTVLEQFHLTGEYNLSLIKLFPILVKGLSDFSGSLALDLFRFGLSQGIIPRDLLVGEMIDFLLEISDGGL